MHNFKMQTDEELDYLLENELKKYPDECVELGDNWELIAKIFYSLGYMDALND